MLLSSTLAPPDVIALPHEYGYLFRVGRACQAHVAFSPCLGGNSARKIEHKRITRIGIFFCRVECRRPPLMALCLKNVYQQSGLLRAGQQLQ
jgi:hypothetical protein